MKPIRSITFLRLAAAVLCLGVALPATAAVGVVTSATPAVSNTTPPTLFGTTAVGHTIAFSTGTWTPSGLTFTYQWKVADVDVAGATESSFPLTADYLGKTVSATVTGSKTGYSSASVTAVAGTVTAGTVVNNTPPTVNGTPKVGHTLGLSTGSWSPSGLTFAYQWKVDGVDVAGATAGTFALTSEYVGKVVSVSVTGSREGYTSATATASTTAVQLGDVVNNTPPTVHGTAKVGHTLGLSWGSWSPSGLTITYQWKVDGVDVAGATAGTFALTSEYVGKVVSVSVTASRAGYTPASATASSTAVQLGDVVNNTPPTVNGTAKVGHTLGLSRGSWSPSGLTFTYQWLLDGTAISGQTGNTLKLKSAYKGKRISVRVTGSRGGYVPLAVVSAKTAKITS